MVMQRLMRMKFLIILRDRYPQFRPDIAVLFGHELAGRGHVMHWRMAAGEPQEKTERVQWGGGPVTVAPRTVGMRWYHRVLNNLRDFTNDVAGLFEKNEYDLVVVKDKFLVALLGPWTARRNKGKFVYWLSYPFPEAWQEEGRLGTARYPRLYGLRGRLCSWLLYSIILPRADHVMVQSEQMKVDVAAHGIDPAKMTAVPMGVDIDSFPKLSPAPESKEVLYLGTLVRVRGLEFLLRVFEKVLKGEPEARLTMIGAGKTEEDTTLLKEEAQRLGIAKHVEFTGFMDRAKALERVREAAVCVSPFKPSPILNSTSPTKLSEYLAMGRPVVASDHPEQSLVLKVSGAGVLTGWNEQEFADGVLELLGKTVNERAAMGRLGRAWVQEHRSYTAIADMVEQTFSALCTRRGEQ